MGTMLVRRALGYEKKVEKGVVGRGNVGQK